MPIYVHLDVDIASSRICASALDELSRTTEFGANEFKKARDKSDAVWVSDAGDAFRDTVTASCKAAEQTSDHAKALADALRTFADSMLTVEKELSTAIARALHAGLRVGPNVFEATWIYDPPPLQSDGTWTIEQRTRQATQIAAYSDAAEMVAHARAIEADAHNSLSAAFADSEGWLDRLRSSAPWMVAGGAISYLGTAAQQANHWSEIAQTRAAQVGRFTDIAGEALPESVRNAATRTLSTFTPAADDAARIAAQNGSLLPGQSTKAFGGLMARTLPFAGKIPVAGAGFTAVQTAYDLQGAEDAGGAAKIVAKDAADSWRARQPARSYLQVSLVARQPWPR